MVSNILLLPLLHCCISSNKFKQTCSFHCTCNFWFPKIILSSRPSRADLIASCSGLSFMSLGCYESSNEIDWGFGKSHNVFRLHLKWISRSGPSGQTFLRTYRAHYWFLTLHFIFIKWRWDLECSKTQSFPQSPPQFVLSLRLFLRVLPLLFHPTPYCVNHITNNQGRVIDMNNRCPLDLHTILCPTYCNKNTESSSGAAPTTSSFVPVQNLDTLQLLWFIWLTLTMEREGLYALNYILNRLCSWKWPLTKLV